MKIEDLLLSILAGNPVESGGQKALSMDEWTDLLKLASILGVAPLLYRPLVMQARGVRIPAEIAADLRAAYFQCLARNAHLFHELGTVLVGFEQAGIPAILLKGAYLADSVYQNAGLRPMGDLDILIPREAILRGIEVLKAAGFAPYQDFTPEVELPLAKHLPPFEKNGTIIELHWDVTSPESPVRVDIPGIWSRAVPFEKENIRALSLCPEDLLLHLCIHAAHHYFYEQLRSLCDIREVLALYGGELNWDKITTRAKGWHAERGVYLALRLAGDLLDAAVPAAVLDSFCPPDYSPEVYAWARGRIFQTEPVLSDNFIALMQGQPGKSRLRAFLDAMVPSPATMCRLYGLPQGSWRVILKYPAHWHDRIRRYRGSTVKMLRGEQRIGENAAVQQRLTEWLNQ